VIRTLIVDDDFRVARLHADVVAATEGFTAAAVVHTASAALEAVKRHRPDLLLLDLYLPDAGGLEILRRVSAQPHPPDAIVLTAARDMASVRSAMRAGAVAYLIKPFDLDDLRQRLDAYAELYARRSAGSDADQQTVDALFETMRRGTASSAPGGLPKGHSQATAELVLDALAASPEPLSAAAVAERVGISRPTAQRYLALLADSGRVQRSLRYGTAGRPEHLYRRG
jgi:response regulator of citrate/malate metabolism